MIEALLAAWALWLIADAFVSFHTGFVRKWRELRHEKIERELEPLKWSTRHKPVLPLLDGMMDELAVTGIIYERKGERVHIELELAWWARPRWLYKDRLTVKAKALLEAGGVREVKP